MRHCGHPTALWPYTGHLPDGRTLIDPGGRAFRKLVRAQEAVERALAGESV